MTSDDLQRRIATLEQRALDAGDRVYSDWLRNLSPDDVDLLRRVLPRYLPSEKMVHFATDERDRVMSLLSDYKERIRKEISRGKQ